MPGRAGRRKKEECAKMTLSPGGKRGVTVTVAALVAVLVCVAVEGGWEWEWFGEWCGCGSGCVVGALGGGWVAVDGEGVVVRVRVARES